MRFVKAITLSLFFSLNYSKAIELGKFTKCLSRLLRWPADLLPSNHHHWSYVVVELGKLNNQLQSTSETQRLEALEEFANIEVNPTTIKKSKRNESAELIGKILRLLAKRYIQFPSSPESAATIKAMTNFYKNNTSLVCLGGTIGNEFYYDYRLPDFFREVVTKSINYSRKNAGVPTLAHVTKDEWIQKEGISFLSGIGKKQLSAEDSQLVDYINRLFNNSKDETKRDIFNKLSGREKYSEEDRIKIIDIVELESDWKLEGLLYILGYTFKNDFDAVYYVHPVDKNRILIHKKSYELHGSVSEDDADKVIQAIKDKADCEISLI